MKFSTLGTLVLTSLLVIGSLLIQHKSVQLQPFEQKYSPNLIIPSSNCAVVDGVAVSFVIDKDYQVQSVLKYFQKNQLITVPYLFYFHEFVQLCGKLDIPVEIAFKIIEVESNWNTEAISSVGAVGLMQVRPIASEDILQYRASEKELKDPFLNLFVGLHYFKKMLEKANGDYNLALMMYNLGMKNTQELLDENPTYDPAEYFYTERIEKASGIFPLDF